MLSTPLNRLAYMIAGMALADRIREILNDKGWIPAQLATMSGVSRASISLYLDGQVKTITLKSAKKISAVTGYNPVWIVDGSGIKKGSKVLSVVDGGKPDKGSPVNPDLLEQAIGLVEKAMSAERKVYQSGKKAGIVLAVYEILAKGGNPDTGTVRTFLRLVS
jgi:transcriptional regulator with XRE-family HTH domain